jgi:hypothetical protein
MAKTIVRSIYASSAATTNDLAHIDIGYSCKVVGVAVLLDPTALAAYDAVLLEVSTASTGQQATNDAQGVIARSAYRVGTTTVGFPFSGSSWQGPMAIDIPAGTRIYIHTVQAGTSATRCSILLHLQIS